MSTSTSAQPKHSPPCAIRGDVPTSQRAPGLPSASRREPMVLGRSRHADIPLCLGDIQSWTKHLHFYGGDVSCTVMPNTAYFDKLRKFGPRSASLCRTPTEPVVVPPTNVPRHRGLHRQYAMHVKEILDVLHARYPAFDYPKYEEPLQTLGIHYLITASMFDEMFYITRVGMVGAAHMFCAWVENHVVDNEDRENIDR